MDFVKREDQSAVEDNYKAYMDSLQKHQIETDFQHTSISMEQLHQAMQSTLSPSIIHNFQLPLSPRQMSTLMLKTNHLSRNLNFNELPGHLTREDLIINDLHQNLRHEDVLSQNFARNLDMSLARNMNDLELQNNSTQNIIPSVNEQDITRNLDLRLNEVAMSQLRSELPHSLSQDMVMMHLNRQNLEHDILGQEESRRTPAVMPDGQILDQVLAQRLNLSLDRLDQSIVQRLNQNLDRLDQRLVNPNLALHERQLDQSEHLLPMQFHIKAEQEDDGYFYDNINQGINNINEINGQIPTEQTQSQQTNIQIDSQMYPMYNNHVNVPSINTLDMYSRAQNYMHNYTTNRDNPQNLVVHKQFELFPDEDLKKQRQEDKKTEEPKENLKPTDQNKMFYEYDIPEKNENDSIVQNKMNSELSVNIKGEYICYKCNDVFPSKRGLKQHSKSCSEDGENQSEKIGKFGCTQCSYRCQSPAILKIHERTHSGEKPFSCTFCEYKSGQKNNVAKHILVHMKEKPFRCQYCDYRCAQKNNLVVHERTHTGYKPFACPYCDYRTVQKPNLVKHMYLHTDQKPFSCDMCSYRCVQKTNLTKHKQRHLNEKDGEKIEVKTQIKPYRPRQKSVKCNLCPYRCVQKSSMEKHVQFKHTGNVDEFTETGVLNENESIQNLSVRKPEFDECQDKILEQVQQ